MQSRMKYNPAVFQKSVGHNAFITNQNIINCSDAQVHHLVHNHHPNNVYSNISKQFVQGIEFKEKPNEDYYKKMKELHLDQLDYGLRDYNDKKQKMNLEYEEFRKQYREKPLGVLNYCEKEEQRRADMFRRTLQKQGERMDRFIDADKIKEDKIRNFVEGNYDPTKMYKSQLLYDQEKNKQEQQMNMQNASMVQETKLKKIEENMWRYKKPLDEHVLEQQKNRINRLKGAGQPLTTYWDQNGNQVNRYSPNRSQNMDQKFAKTMENSQNFTKNQAYRQSIDENIKNEELNGAKRPVYKRHNPITNPIQYHVENPYFITKLQQKYRC